MRSRVVFAFLFRLIWICFGPTETVKRVQIFRVFPCFGRPWAKAAVKRVQLFRRRRVDQVQLFGRWPPRRPRRRAISWWLVFWRASEHPRASTSILCAAQVGASTSIMCAAQVGIAHGSMGEHMHPRASTSILCAAQVRIAHGSMGEPPIHEHPRASCALHR